MTTALETALTQTEQQRLQELETVVERGLKAFVEVGNALMEIRESRLYRAQYSTFDEYCQERWGFTAERARLYMRGSEVMAHLSETPTMVGVLPANERQIRPLTKLDPDEQIEVWEMAVETAPNGKVTGAHVQKTVEEYTEPEQQYAPVWKLENDVRAYLDSYEKLFGKTVDIADRIDILARMKKLGYGALTSSGLLTGPYRMRDVKQAVGNVLEQLRQQQTTQTSQAKMAVHYSSESDEWETPQWLFDLLYDEFKFGIDVAASSENAKVRPFFSVLHDGLAQDWKNYRCWLNPPYGREIGKWVEKAYRSALDGATVVCLIPARTDTRWWWDYVIKGEIRFLKGRLKFGNADNGAPFPSAVVVFYPGVPEKKCTVRWWEIGEGELEDA